jgi:probable selenium-dependent hydroxylase accessory protein YqeC
MGAGGKATLMKRLILEAQKSDSPILVTGTTNLHSFKNSTGLQTISGYEGIKVSQKDEKILWAKKKLPNDIFHGFSTREIDGIQEKVKKYLIIVKTDGARKRLIKVPNSTEPLIPKKTTHCVAIFNMQSIGQKASSELIHRFELCSQIAKLKKNNKIECSHLANLISYKNGYLSRMPKDSKKILYLSGCLKKDDLKNAEKICKSIEKIGYDMLIFGDTIEKKFFLYGE